MKQKTQEYVQFIKENHKDFRKDNWLKPESLFLNGAQCAKALGISQGRVSQLLKEIKAQPVNQDATASTAEA